jgi:SAM-dependent methyltransferase
MRDAVHLEIGCGAVNPFGRLFAHLLLGARRGIAVELEPQRDAPAGARFLAKLAATAWVEPRRIYGDFPVDRAAMTANLAGFDLAKLACGDVAGLAPDRLELRLEPIESMGLPTGSVDVVLSSSVLEHLSDVDAALRELRRVTRPGGFGIHGVDTIDHWWYGHPEQHALEFLTVDAAEAMVHGSNRLRLHELDARFAAHGFTVLERWPYNKVAITPQLRGRLREPWRSMPDELLDTTWCQYLLRRDGSP